VCSISVSVALSGPAQILFEDPGSGGPLASTRGAAEQEQESRRGQPRNSARRKLTESDSRRVSSTGDRPPEFFIDRAWKEHRRGPACLRPDRPYGFGIRRRARAAAPGPSLAFASSASPMPQLRDAELIARLLDDRKRIIRQASRQGPFSSTGCTREASDGSLAELTANS